LIQSLLSSPSSGSHYNLEESRYYLSQAAKQNHIESMFELGEALMKEEKKKKQKEDKTNLNENRKEAIEWYKKAAEAGHAQSQYIIGMMCAENKIILDSHSSPSASSSSSPRSHHYHSVEWFQLASNQGHVGSQCRLGFLYYNGIGVDAVDKSTGIMWLTNAAEAVSCRDIKCERKLQVLISYSFLHLSLFFLFLCVMFF
jgi:TPR repeat protein